MKTLTEYLAEYIDEELLTNLHLKDVIEQGIYAYESTENCTIRLVGGDCPDCKAAMEKGESVLYAGCDEIEVVSYQCPECGYIVYG